ncbi:slit homolog 2 protein-like isoform X2 [Ostrea edulis]|uniref:slit homolog 2 protein-like isoform X2 n=1 Tax=Ostrea edulis TaxID=37623 RepID=UPI0024AEEF54|nr:slit homolog 2 protein-like isoform X2 [Ostrea edulis]
MYSWALWTLMLHTAIYSCVTGACTDRCSCDRAFTCDGTGVECGYQGLTRVPTDFPIDTCSMDLSSNDITTIEDGAFFGLSGLQSLDLSTNKITNIENGAFCGLTSLQSLDLSFNDITIIVDGAFFGLSGLQSLDFSLNKITNIENGVFLALTSLQTIDLSSNKITNVENGAFLGLTSLQSLSIGDNPFHCDCSLEAFTQFLRGRPSYLNNPQCSTPGDLAGTELMKVSFEDMDCTKQNNVSLKNMDYTERNKIPLEDMDCTNSSTRAGDACSFLRT